MKSASLLHPFPAGLCHKESALRCRPSVAACPVCTRTCCVNMKVFQFNWWPVHLGSNQSFFFFFFLNAEMFWFWNCAITYLVYFNCVDLEYGIDVDEGVTKTLVKN